MSSLAYKRIEDSCYGAVGDIALLVEFTYSESKLSGILSHDIIDLTVHIVDFETKKVVVSDIDIGGQSYLGKSWDDIITQGIWDYLRSNI